MPKHIIEFNLPDETEDLDLVMHAGAYWVAIDEIRQLLRKYRNYYEFSPDESAYDFFEKFAKELSDILVDVID